MSTNEPDRADAPNAERRPMRQRTMQEMLASPTASASIARTMAESFQQSIERPKRPPAGMKAMDPALACGEDAGPLARDLACRVVRRLLDPRLKWTRDGRVRVLADEALPEGLGQESGSPGRRARLKSLREELTRILADVGWASCGHDVYRDNTLDPEDAV